MASKFAECKLGGLSRVVCNVGTYCKLKTKPKTITKLKESLQVIWSNLPQGPIDKTVKVFSNYATEGLCWSLELSVDTSNIHSDNGILASDH